MIVSFCQSVHERIEIDMIRYEHEPGGESWDDHSLMADVRVRSGGFRAKVSAAFSTSDLTDFLSDLRPLGETAKGSAELKALDDQLHLRLTGHAEGEIELRGEVRDAPDKGNRLHFILHFNQLHLCRGIQELQKIVAEFRVREMRRHKRV